MAQKIIKELVELIGRENVLYSRSDLLAYSYNANQHQEVPEVIVFPRNTEEISKIIKIAYQQNKTFDKNRGRSASSWHHGFLRKRSPRVEGWRVTSSSSLACEQALANVCLKTTEALHL